MATRQNDIIRAAILAEYKKRKLNPYQLWKLVEGKMGRSTVYAFVGGSILGTDNASDLLAALNLTVKHQNNSR